MNLALISTETNLKWICSAQRFNWNIFIICYWIQVKLNLWFYLNFLFLIFQYIDARSSLQTHNIFNWIFNWISFMHLHAIISRTKYKHVCGMSNDACHKCLICCVNHIWIIFASILMPHTNKMWAFVERFCRNSKLSEHHESLDFPICATHAKIRPNL